MSNAAKQTAIQFARAAHKLRVAALANKANAEYTLAQMDRGLAPSSNRAADLDVLADHMNSLAQLCVFAGVPAEWLKEFQAADGEEAVYVRYE